jgi:hypothetical protein
MSLLRRAGRRMAADRTVPTVLGAYFLFAAWQLFQLWQDTDDHVFFDWLWPYVFALAGVTSVAYAIRHGSHLLAAWSGGLMIAACLSRAWAVVTAVALNRADIDDARGWLIAGTYIVLAYAIAAIWHRILGPATHLRRHR